MALYGKCDRSFECGVHGHCHDGEARLNFKFTIGNLLVFTAVVAVIVAAIARLGIEVGILALFLGVADIVIVMRFYAARTAHDTNIAWTVAAACVIFPLTMLLIFGVINGNPQHN